MSDIEAPLTKKQKYEEYLEDEEECMDEGQEEWLSEGVLTDDDNPMDKDSQIDNTSQEDQDTMSSIPDQDNSSKDQTMDQDDTNNDNSNSTQKTSIDSYGAKIKEFNQDQETSNSQDKNIEATLNSMDNAEKNDDFPEDLDDYLIRKQELSTNIKIETNGGNVKQEPDDGNDTDDLLRMLGEGEQKKKKLYKVKSIKQAPDTSDDELVYEKEKVKTLKVAKTAVKKIAPKAEPETMSEEEEDPSSDDAETVHKMFEVTRNAVKKGQEETKRKRQQYINKMKQEAIEEKRRQIEAARKKHEEISRLARQRQEEKRRQEERKRQEEERKKKENRDIVVKIAGNRVMAKPESRIKPSKLNTPKSILKTPIRKLDITPVHPEAKVQEKESVKKVVIKGEDEILDEEYLDDDEDFEMDDEEFGSDSEYGLKQRIMRPESMDEEVPSDEETNSEAGSLYDELPSSDSEDIDDWFNIDIRTERASDYLPLLGPKAKEVLLLERNRVAARVSSLRQSLSALTESARRQADCLRTAAMCLAEVDDTLRAA